MHQHPPRPILLSLTLILATIGLGLAIRFAHLGLPASIVKYGGSMLWACEIYWLISTLFAKTRIAFVALASAALAIAVEFFKHYNTRAIDAFRHTLAGILLLGRIFSWWDIVAYCAAIAAAALLDNSLLRKTTRTSVQIS